MKFCMNCMAQYGDEYSICPICSFKEGTLPSDQRCIEPGQVLADRYIIGMPLSISNWIVKYIGWDALTNRKVVINEYLPTKYAAREIGNIQLTIVKQKPFYKYLNLLLKKAQLLSETHLPDNICSVYESFEKNNTAYVIMEYMEGMLLGDYIKEKKPVQLKTVERMFVPILKSIDKLHENGFIVGSFSPDSFIVTDDNILVLRDYIGNLFYNISETGSERKKSTQDAYFPPEKLKTSETVELSPENDVYSSAMIMYEMLGADLPDWQARTETFEQKHKDTLKKLSSFGTKIDRYKENALINALAVSMSDRTADIETFIKEFVSGKDVALNSKKKNRFPLWAKIAIPVAAVLVICAAVFIPIMLNNDNNISSKTSSTMTEGQTIVPGIVNYTLSEAKEELQKRNLLIEVEAKEINDDKEQDTVLAQNIKKGSIVSENTVVGVTVSKKSGEFTMPNFLGIDFSECRDVLENIGLNYSVSEEYNQNISSGCVFYQSVSPYSTVTSGQRVEIKVSKGIDPAELKSESEQEVVKDLVGQTYDNIIDDRSDNTPPVQVVERVYDNSKPEGTVVQQSVIPGDKVRQDEPVKIVVTTANNKVIIPDVTYLDQERSQKLLMYYGLKSEFSFEENDTVAEGLAVSQDPEGGKDGLMGDTIKVVISKGREMIKVPDVVGKERSESVKLLKTTGLSVSYSFEADSSKPRNEVLAQNIAGGTEVKKGSPIVITLNTSNDVKKVPDILGMTVEKADEAVIKAGFNLLIYSDEEHPYTEGIIYAQGPDGGYFAEKGSDIVVLLQPAESSDSSDEEILLSTGSRTLSVGEEFMLTVDTSKIIEKSEVTYKVSDPSVIEILSFDKDMLALTVLGKSVGNSEITISCGNFEKTCTFEVNDGKKTEPDIELDTYDIISRPGERFTIDVEPYGIENTNGIDYKIADTSIVEVIRINNDTMEMTFVGVKPGKTEIVFSYGDIRKTCNVTIE